MTARAMALSWMRWTGIDRLPFGPVLLLGLGVSGLLLTVVPPLMYVAGIIGLFMTLLIGRDPRLGLYLTVASIPMEAAGMVARLALNTTVTITKVLALLTLAAWILHLVTGRRRLLWTRETQAFALVIAFAAVSLVDTRELSNGIQGLVRLGSTFAFFLMAANLLTTRDEVKRVLAILLVTSCAMFAFAVLQRYIPQFTFGQRPGWSEGGDWNYGVEQVTIDPAGGSFVARSSGTTLHAVVLSVTSATMVPLLVAFMVASRHRGSRFASAAGLAAALAANLVSVSRTGVVIIALCLGYMLLRGVIRLSGRVVIVGVLLLAAVAPFVPTAFLTRLFEPDSYRVATSESLQIRQETNLGALNAIRHHPINGLGVGNMLGIQDYYVDPRSDYLQTKGLKNFSTANNTYLQTAMEIGIPGLLALLWLFWRLGAAARAAGAAFQSRGDTELALVCECLVVVLAGMLAAGFMVDFVQQTFKGFWLMMACTIVLRRIATSEADAAGTRRA